MRILCILQSWYENKLFLLLGTDFAQIQKGSSQSRSDDTKTLKSVILDWIMPRGQALNPPLARNIKHDRGFHHEKTGALLCPAGLDWSDAESVPFIYVHI